MGNMCRKGSDHVFTIEEMVRSRNSKLGGGGREVIGCSMVTT
jgi:hypothetical protein